jgi:predicted RNase H-like HicB family nuclease
MVEIQPIRVEMEREEDGRILASVPDLPGVYRGERDTLERITDYAWDIAESIS